MPFKIKKIILHKVRMDLLHPFTNSLSTVTAKDFFVVEAIDESNLSGFGESVAFTEPWYTEETVTTTEYIIDAFLMPLLINSEITHPNQVSPLFSTVRRNHMAKACVEAAIWDLYAKQQGITLSKLIGGNKTKIEAGISLGMQSSMEKLLSTIGIYVKQGYKRIKIKIKPGQDLNVLKEIRQHYPDIPLMVDANSAYTLDDLEHLKKFDQFNLMMIEQPLGHDDMLDHAKLQSEMATPICLDESIHSLNDAKVAIELGSCQIINIKIGRVGGLSEAIKIHSYCQKKNIAVWCGGMIESGIGRAHNIALATLSQFTLPGDIASSAHYWMEDLILPEIVVEDGFIWLENQPGIGYHINTRLLKHLTTSKKKYKF